MVWVMKSRIHVEADSSVKIPMTNQVKDSTVALGKYGVER